MKNEIKNLIQFKNTLLIVMLLLVSSAFGQWTQLGGDMLGDAAGDDVGYSVGLSADGSRVAVGAVDGASNGYVDIYEWNTGTLSWDKMGRVAGEASGDDFGWAVSLSDDGNTLAVGAIGNDGGGSGSGHVRLFEWNGTVWAQKGTDVDGGLAGAKMGSSVAMNSDGSVFVGGAYNYKVGTETRAGRGRVFEWDSGTGDWVQRGASLEGLTGGYTYLAYDYLGIGSSINDAGDIVALGAMRHDTLGANSGITRVFKWDGTSWNPYGSAIAGVTGDYSGRSVSLSSSGDTIAIGGYQNYAIGGVVRVYYYNAGVWTQVGADVTGLGSGEYSGYSVALAGNGTRFITGAYQHDDSGLRDAGETRSYEWDGSAWVQYGGDVNGGAAYDYDGKAVAISYDGEVMATGGNGHDILASGSAGSLGGRARVFGYIVVLPVELLSFNAILKDSEVDVSWETTTEINNDYFTIERSTNGVEWETLESVSGAGNSNSHLDYQRWDHSPYSDLSYYRLKQTDFDGSTSYSKIVSVNNFGKRSLSIYPNPAKDVLTVANVSEQITVDDVQLLNALGQEIRVPFIQKENAIEFNVSELEKGIYFLKYLNAAVENYKFVVQ